MVSTKNVQESVENSIFHRIFVGGFHDELENFLFESVTVKCLEYYVIELRLPGNNRSPTSGVSSLSNSNINLQIVNRIPQYKLARTF